MDSGSDAPSLEEPGINAKADNEALAAFSIITTGPLAVDSDIEHMNHQFDAIDFNKVRVAGNDTKVIVEPEGKAQQRAILMLCGKMGWTTDDFDPSKLSPFPINNTVVFVCFATGHAYEDVYEGPYAIETIDHPGRAHTG